MAAKGTRTRRRIVEQAAAVFNARGYQATTLGDLMAATGLEKGGIYNHFGSKDDLALAAYEHNVEVVSSRIAAAVRAETGAVDRLVAFLETFRGLVHAPPFPGGCPTLNTAVEADGVDPRLHARAQQALRELQASVRSLVRRGVDAGELRADADPVTTGVVVVAALEGGLLLAECLRDPGAIDAVVDHLEQYVRSLAVPGAPRDDDTRGGTP